MIYRLTPTECFEQWDDIKPFIDMAIVDEHYTSEDIKKHLLEGITRAYKVVADGVIMAVVTAELVIYPKAKVVRIHTAGGKDMSMWAEKAIKAISEDGIRNGARELQIIGRKGWLKVLDGFKEQYTVMSKAI